MTFGYEFVQPPLSITYACTCPLDWWWREGSEGGNGSGQNGHI